MSHFQGFQRKTFPVQAARVTPLNIEELAEVCGGKVMHDGEKEGNYSRDYIKVRVAFPLNEEQTKARIGDWLVKQGRTFKVYKDKPFRSTFELPGGGAVPQLSTEERQAIEGVSAKEAAENPELKHPSPANMPKKMAPGVPTEDISTGPGNDEAIVEHDDGNGAMIQHTPLESGESAEHKVGESGEVAEGLQAEVSDGTPGPETTKLLENAELKSVSLVEENPFPGAGEMEVSEPEKKTPITLDELNDTQGDPRSTQEIMREGQ